VQPIAKQPPKGELVILGFDYTPLDAKIAEQARSTADRIRERLTKTLEDLIEVGNDLLAVKEALDHGQFGAWLGPSLARQSGRREISCRSPNGLANRQELPI
jgi:hypothetical protein